MMIQWLVLGLILSAGTASAATTTHVDRPGSISVRIEVNYGLLDQCGAREIPHLIEHTILSETSYGQTPADLIAGLNGLGVRLSAVTRQDFTEYVFEGDEGAGPVIHDAVMQTLGREMLPEDAIGREVEAIRLELGAAKGFVSQAHSFEPWAYQHVVGAPAPCSGENTPVDAIDHETITHAFSSNYRASNYTVSVVAPEGEFDTHALRAALDAARPGLGVEPRTGSSSNAPLPDATLVGTSTAPVTAMEALIAVPGRTDLPPARAKAIAEQVKLDVQAVLRAQPVSYVARLVVHQSNSAGWISITAEVPTELHEELVGEIRNSVLEGFAKGALAPIRMALLSNRELVENVHLESFHQPVAAQKLEAGSVEIRYFKPGDGDGLSRKHWLIIAGVMTFLIFLGIFRSSGGRIY